jgi:hypothetical protein
LESLTNPSPERSTKRLHVALPIRVTYWDSANRPCLEFACTYDISQRGARIGGLRCVKETGEIIAVERGRNRVFCRVVWIGPANSELRGQVGIECVETGRTIWDAELRDMEEAYEPILVEARQLAPNGLIPGVHQRNRRRYERFDVEGMADLKNGPTSAQMEAALRNLSEMGCLLATKQKILPGSELKVFLKVASYHLSLKGQVRHTEAADTLGVEFREIRKGDRQILHFLLRKLAEKQLEDIFHLEVQS